MVSRAVVAPDNLTHADAVTRVKAPKFGSVTASSTPSKTAAAPLWPCCPVAGQVAPLHAPVSRLGDPSGNVGFPFPSRPESMVRCSTSPAGGVSLTNCEPGISDVKATSTLLTPDLSVLPEHWSAAHLLELAVKEVV